MFYRNRDFKWKFKDFKKVMKSGVRLKKHLNSDDLICMNNMAMMHGGKYWATTDGGIVALPYDSEKFNFNEWVS